jgi:Tfp pilus assembly protein PilF/SAM-dependent methyltransferase
MALSVAQIMQQAMAHHGRGELECASHLYDEVLEAEPENPDALHLRGVVAHQQDHHEHAVALIGRAIAMRPRQPALRNNLGMALAALGRTTEAEGAYGEALAIDPDFSDALLNLGNLRLGQGRAQEAVELLARAVALDADAPQGHYNLGCARLALGEHRQALESLERAVALGADFAELHFRIGAARAALGDAARAVAGYRRALESDPDHRGAQHGLLECLRALTDGVAADRVEAIVAPLLRAPSVNPRALGHASARLLEHKHALGDDAAVQSVQQSCEGVLEDPVARLYLRRTLNVSVPLERLLTRSRARWLADENEHGTASAARLEAVASVAVQCFLNEFVWAVTAEEARAVDALERRIVDACASTVAPDEALARALALYACYRPLWRLPCASRLASIEREMWPAALGEALRVCLHEPLEERALEARIVSATATDDPVSTAVRAQYEENPYPRWVAITRGGVERIEQRVQRWCPRYDAPVALRGPLRVLVAGCGTGMDAIETAVHLEGAQVTAVDLSRASLAFAVRKAEEYGLENIRFRQQDILALGEDEEPYHFIHCTGVLHHMGDPAAGLERLARVLMPGGLMKLALYSRLARAPLVEVRDAIRAAGYGPGVEDIRAFRQRLVAEGAEGPHAELMGSTDFFSVSECRDLLFHAHETQLTLPEIGHMLEAQCLDFLGFELTIPQVEQGFRSAYPDAASDDLDAWDAYERRHPHSFRAMYQFWCEKRGA